MKIFRSEQIREIDNYTIINEPVPSVELMERAAGKVLSWFVSRFERNRKVFIFAGPGNNGGDGLALARMLIQNRYEVEIHYVKFTDKTSPDWEINQKRLKKEVLVVTSVITSVNDFPFISSNDVIIDAIFGSGLTRTAEGLPAEIIKKINDNDALTISIDIPSGLFCEDNSRNNTDNIIKAHHTLSFQFPKLAFMFPENAGFVGSWEVLPIGLSDTATRNTRSPYRYIEFNDIFPLLHERSKFDHKGHYGHGLLVAGSKGKMGAAILGASAALRAGIGLITCHIPSGGRVIMQASLSEAMVITDKTEDYISRIDISDSYTASGIGPGIGTNKETATGLYEFLKEFRKPVVVDADALNILAVNNSWYSLLHSDVILTPHPKEFERLAGGSKNGYERVRKQSEFSGKHNCIVVLKGAYTSVSTPDGNIMFNSSGNPGMATAGSGDVLTGIILSLLAQGYSAENAALAGVFIHGLAGDIAAEKTGFEALIASDIINNTGNAYKKIREWLI
ncbi:MAG TPA: NAD(P)H-hydrate dehydratase [Bacteroidales bacterium]|nr:NAD(P)H-hydrate dehydratase [Bacteroidales bacterium]